MGKEPTISEINKELWEMREKLIESLREELFKGNPDDPFIHYEANSDAHITLYIGSYNIALDLEVKPFVQSIFLKTSINDEEIDELNILGEIDHRLTRVENKEELDYGNFGKSYLNILMQYLQNLENKEVKDFFNAPPAKR